MRIEKSLRLLGQGLAVLILTAALAACGGSSGASSDTSSSTSGTPSSATLQSTPGQVALTASSYTVAPSSSAVVSINRTAGSTGTATVSYTTANGTATAGTDYVATSGTVTWGDGDSGPKLVTVPVTSLARGKSFRLSLTSVAGQASFGSPTAATVTVSSNSTGSSSSSGSSGGSSTTTATQSASGTMIPTNAQQITDSAWTVWTLKGGAVYEQVNGAANASPAGSSSNVVLVLYYNGVIYQENGTRSWWLWNGTAWTATSDPRVAAGVAEAAYYVSTGGSDSNAGTLAAPFLTLAKAQSAMRNSAIKTTYVRAGTYPNVALTLGSADNGETWSYYPSDGYNSAILDGGATKGSSSNKVITIDGASNITINGFTIQNFGFWGVGMHGGAAFSDYGFPNATAASSNITVSNNIFLNGYSTADNGWNGAIYGVGHTDNVTVSNNAIQNMYGGGIWFWPDDNYANAGSTQNNLIIENNVVLNVCTQSPDCGAIYRQDTNMLTTGAIIHNNFIRDYQGNIQGGSINNSGNNLKRAVAIYLDQGASNTQIIGNVIGNTANLIVNSGVSPGSTTVFWANQSQNVTWSGNIIDLGTVGTIATLGYANASVAPGRSLPMTGNSITGNIFIGKWSGAQHSTVEGITGAAWDSQSSTNASVSHNLYYNYGSGSILYHGNAFSDASPVTGTNPQISGATYTLASNSPAYNAPVSFPAIVGGWGPPGYVIPAGTPPSP